MVRNGAEKCSTDFNPIIKTEFRMTIHALFPFCMNLQGASLRKPSFKL
jgi:hypothetical protein